MTSAINPVRRKLLKGGAAVSLQATVGMQASNALGAAAAELELPFDNGHRELVVFPQKRPLILLTNRPPQLETPFDAFREGVITPNDAFFVRYHWSAIPTSIDPEVYRLKVDGNVSRPLSLTLSALRRLADPVEVVAVNQCSGNSRGFFSPRTNGGQLGNGAMGNARWTGIPLKALLQRAGVKQGAIQVSFDGLDRPPLDKGPDFIKALTIEHAMDGEVMLAWAMNGKDLPVLNGYPLRLVVPGYYGTYWVKHLCHIQVLSKPFEGFWMSHAYRIPDNECACVSPSGGLGGTVATVPIGRLNVRSFITSHASGNVLRVGRMATIKGIAFDGGQGISEVLFSNDGGGTWRSAKLGVDLGAYSFREWSVAFQPHRAGVHDLRVRATSRSGNRQPLIANWNSGGYMRNGVESVKVLVQ